MHSIPVEDDQTFRVSLDVHSVCLTDDQFYRLCGDNPELRLELSADGELIIMSPTHTKTGWKEARILQRLANWTERDGTGLCFGSSTGFRLPNGAKRSPDASWISRGRWNSLSAEDREGMARISPDFVVELRSATDTIPQLQEKMREYLENGTRLGWLLDPFQKQLYVYRPGRSTERHVNPEFLNADEVLPGFEFDFQEILQEPL